MRETIRTLVRTIKPADELEYVHQRDALTWIASGAPLCRTAPPATPPMHLVAYFAVVDPATRKLLLVDHRKAGLWLPSGGHVEPGEDPRETVRREANEELGLTAQFLIEQPLFLTITQTVGSTAGHTDVSVWYAIQGDSAAPIHFDQGEFHGVAWFAFDELPLPRTDPHLERFVRKLSHMFMPAA